MWCNQVVVVDGGVPLLCRYLATMSFDSRKSGYDIIQDIDKIFGKHLLFDIEAVSQIEGLTWPCKDNMQELARLFELQIIGDITTLPHSFMIAIKYQILIKLYNSNIPHVKWIGLPHDLPDTRFLVGSDISKCLI